MCRRHLGQFCHLSSACWGLGVTAPPPGVLPDFSCFHQLSTGSLAGPSGVCGSAECRGAAVGHRASSCVCPVPRTGLGHSPIVSPLCTPPASQPASLCSAIFKTPKENSHLCLLETWRVPRSQELCSFSNLPELALDIKPNKQTERGLLCKKVPPN